MEKVNDVVIVLKNYKKIVEVTGGINDSGLDEFIEVLKIYKKLTFDEFKQKLVSDNKVTSKKKNLKDEAIDLGILYYQRNKGNSLVSSDQLSLNTFLALPENKVLDGILNSNLELAYETLMSTNDKDLTINHLFFLGMALLKVKLRGSKKADYKKNLLDILWSVIENDRMNAVYDEID
ncbi:hypothetical protein [Turicibacter sanguinis]|uniref:hypothetical protein n=1 Tax=Turicibacter sanguinis TaxID=154288 RepID=UPI0018A936B7|nr:hypothetical protein [Turicibacter sanguinis]MDB8551883.1 hypothetical protein [Turicibacter sanguinis]